MNSPVYTRSEMISLIILLLFVSAITITGCPKKPPSQYLVGAVSMEIFMPEGAPVNMVGQESMEAARNLVSETLAGRLALVNDLATEAIRVIPKDSALEIRIVLEKGVPVISKEAVADEISTFGSLELWAVSSSLSSAQLRMLWESTDPETLTIPAAPKPSEGNDTVHIQKWCRIVPNIAPLGTVPAVQARESLYVLLEEPRLYIQKTRPITVQTSRYRQPSGDYVLQWEVSPWCVEAIQQWAASMEGEPVALVFGSRTCVAGLYLKNAGGRVIEIHGHIDIPQAAMIEGCLIDLSLPFRVDLPIQWNAVGNSSEISLLHEIE